MTFTPDDNTNIGRREIKPVNIRGKEWGRAAGEIEDFTRNVLDSISGGKPALHGSTHLGGTDNIVNEDDTPSQVTPDGVADAGSAATGVAAFDHVHSAPVGSAVGLGNANAPGVANAFSRSDHVHKRDVRVAKGGADVGTRNRFNLIEGAGITLTVTDDAGGDKVDVTVAQTDDTQLLAWAAIALADQ